MIALFHEAQGVNGHSKMLRIFEHDQKEVAGSTCRVFLAD